MSQHRDFILRPPVMEDAARMWRFVIDSKTLDPNSPYCYLVLCRHFTDTCVIAEAENALAGFIAGYRPPGAQNTVVVWQMGTGAPHRRRGLGLAMLGELLRREECREVSYLEATVTPSNPASRAMLTALARELKADYVASTGFEASLFPKERPHEPERLFRIGPFPRVL
uniref:L-2,4-diaminobutyric acid acetyltransferase n=1 Tax=Candidatus Kentrum eta TaxID=2126337 RepID=A0A450UCB7_9GAMM|nr:MAG: diaminobutyrate acetyltransferase [Candidatus Kentron sp. H]VFJ89932.1 MAG: diaminobutyrate acetyltransferase [Candidatus Kentron sp. H]VFJ96314.1 MAG: diaminobutyrate acetyltransferase [Candidatus Kentron sp. H]